MSMVRAAVPMAAISSRPRRLVRVSAASAFGRPRRAAPTTTSSRPATAVNISGMSESAMPCSFRPGSADMWSIGIAGSIAKECWKATAEETSTITPPRERSRVAAVALPGAVVDKGGLRLTSGVTAGAMGRRRTRSGPRPTLEWCIR